ncbi:Rcs stress response system protein RcsF [Thalassotalea sp. G2M2-11]|uniref:Rcs stress response system protein RcsF n=1 Tax=Thalassotalea sp. G2M2-11 TaxID=2787627 RepID=UPI0019D2AF21|nr:Rcs stress response system protein RcsF [Thalassotalea sp. G2M2-11]
MKHLLMLMSTLLLSGCAQHYSISTNLDKQNFSEYFSATKVKIYQEKQIQTLNARYLAAVEGESCQSKASHDSANEIDARTHARRNAYQLGANAIVFSGCALLQTAQTDKKCITTRVCYGKAYIVAQ